MTRRLVLSYLALAVLILAVLELPLAALAARFERELATAQVNQEIGSLVVVVGDDLDDRQGADVRTVVSDYGSRTGGEVTVVSPALSTIAVSSRDADNDARDDWLSLTNRALAGTDVSAFTADEGQPWAVAAAPVTSDGRVVAVVVLGNPASFTEHRIHEVWLALGLFAVIALVVTASVGYLLARSVSLPLGHLKATVDRLGRGDLSARADLHGPSDVVSLAAQFNHMAERLNELLVAQAHFVADASHQLRSPLAALRLRVENLEARGGAGAEEAIPGVSRELQRLSRIVDGLLTLSRADQEEPQRTGVDVAAVVGERAEAWSALAEERQVQLSVGTDRSGPVPLVSGDLEQILDNLLANALDAVPRGGHIDVRLTGGGGVGFAVHVRDDGPGLDPESRRRAFDRFWRGSSGKGGSGLGLAIARQLARRNGLTVELLPVEPHGLDAVVTLRRSAGAERPRHEV